MFKTVIGKSTTTAALTILFIAGLAACTKREIPPLSELPPSTSPAQPSPTPPPIENDQAQGELAAIGAIQTVRGWTLPITDVNFKAGRLSLEPGDQRIDQVAATLKKRPQLRVLIEAHADQTNSTSRARSASKMHAEEVLRALTAKGVDVAQIQARGRANPFSDIPEDPGVILIFSNAEGEFAFTAGTP
jgi:outer membrane protein OmpA-like peptidoglycan-associated protein